MNPMRLFVNVDHVATVREARKTDEPDPVRAAVLVELGGADGITVHLREDRRHIRDRDVRLLAETLRTPLNLELASAPDILGLALELQPHQATVVPERRDEITTEGGLHLADPSTRARVEQVVVALREGGIRTSLFVDPDEEALRAAASMKVEAVELHTGEYANAHSAAEADRQVERLRRSAIRGRELGLDVHAGHGLTYENVTPVASIPELEELNIGHSVISRAVLVGLERAVAEMGLLIREARRGEGR
ncbi:MAG: pyridoxine 5'-phosphate synthase [Gemmatimonadales bacterium]|nr:MAG: pyridoxine 5'-phosphate synthase [Gemmatimonadales bacterium]